MNSKKHSSNFKQEFKDFHPTNTTTTITVINTVTRKCSRNVLDRVMATQNNSYDQYITVLLSTYDTPSKLVMTSKH